MYQRKPLTIDFDEKIDRRHTEATKWDRYASLDSQEDLLPLWLADMDFKTAAPIYNAIQKRAQHPIYGYTDRSPAYLSLFADRFHARYQYDVTPEQVTLSTGVMYSISAAIRLFTKEGDQIMIMLPAYHPFIDMVEGNGRCPLYTTMRCVEGIWSFDFKAMEATITTQTKAIILCNPHNPTGRVFTKAELKEFASFCETHQLIIISDEIHCDFVYPGNTFYPVMNISEYTKEHTISCVAPTKSFNLAGLKISAAFIKNKEMQEAFHHEAKTIGISSINLFAMAACKAAYTSGDDWLSELLQYLAGNRECLDQFLKEQLPLVDYVLPEGTYFGWLNFQAYQQSFASLSERLMDQAHVVLSDGLEFDHHADGWMRLNFACPRVQLEEALQRIASVLNKGGAL